MNGSGPRWMLWPELRNARDLGPLPLASGGTTRPGVAVRSDDLSRLTARGERLMRSAAPSLIVDLRAPWECHALPSRCRASPAYRSLPLLTDVQQREVSERFAVRRSGFYPWMADAGRTAAAQVVRAIAEQTGLCVFHCSLGKDRTGLVAALILLSVGVSEEAVLADYLLSAPRVGAASEPFLMTELFEHLRVSYGGAEAYLGDAGAGASTLAELRARFGVS